MICAPAPRHRGPVSLGAILLPVSLLIAIAAGCHGPVATSGPDAAVGPSYHFKTDPIHLEAGGESTTMTPGNFSNDRAIWITRFQMHTQPGLHHFRMDAPPDMRFPVYTIFSPPVGSWEVDQPFSPGFALSLPAAQPLWLSMHYLNASPMAQDYTLEMVVDTLPEGAPAPIPLSQIAFLTESISLPPLSATDVDVTCIIPTDIDLHSLLSHTHGLGKGVDAVVVGGEHDGETIYTTTEWDGAPNLKFDPPLHLRAGDAIHWTCHYYNDTGKLVQYGASAAEEMCGVAGYYSPGPVPIFGMVQMGQTNCTVVTLD